MAPAFEELFAKAKYSKWKLEFGYTILAVVEHNGVDYVIGQNDWVDENGQSKRGRLGPMTLIEVLDFRLSETLASKIQKVEEERPLDEMCFFVFGLYALYALLAEGLIHGTLVEKPNGVFEGIIEIDEKKYAFSAFEIGRPMADQDFILVDATIPPYKIL